jgi:hypothetical protein
MEIEQGKRYLVVADGHGEKAQLDEIVIVEVHGKFVKTMNVVTGSTEWRFVTDLEMDAVENLPPLPGQYARMGID